MFSLAVSHCQLSIVDLRYSLGTVVEPLIVRLCVDLSSISYSLSEWKPVSY